MTNTFINDVPGNETQWWNFVLPFASIFCSFLSSCHLSKFYGDGNNVDIFHTAMPFLIKMIHGNDIGLQKFIRLFRKRWTLETKKEGVSEENWESHCTISKRQVERKVTGIAKKELRPSIPKPRWYVHSNILASYKLEDIALPVNGFVTTNPKEKSLSPVPPQTKSPIITSFTDVRDSLVKVNGTVVKETKSENMDVNSMDTTPPVRLE